MNVGRSVGLGAIILAVLLCFPVCHFAVLRVQTQCLARVRQMPHAELLHPQLLTFPALNSATFT